MSNVFQLVIDYIQKNTLFVCIILGSIAIAILASLAVIYKKIKVSPWKALVPIYNVITLFSILEIPVWMVVVLFIPFVNFFGIPVLMFCVGWKLGQYCYKGPVMRAGLMIFPPLFYPLLASSRIDLDDPYGEKEIVVELPQEFTLEAVEVKEVEVSNAYVASEETLNQIAPPKAKRNPIITKKEPSTVPPKAVEPVAVKEEKPIQEPTIEQSMKVEEPPKEGPIVENSVQAEEPKEEIVTPPVEEKKEKVLPSKEEQNEPELEDVNKPLPTADDFTFDYNSLYGNATPKKEVVEPPKEEKPIKVEQPMKEEPPKEEVLPSKEETPLVEETLQEEEPTVEDSKVEVSEENVLEEEPKEVLPVIHDVVLEEAEPITDMGIIPINQRYDYRKTPPKKDEIKPMEEVVKEEIVPEEPVEPPVEISSPVVEEPKVEETPVPEPTLAMPPQEVPPTSDLPMMAAPPDLSMPEVKPVETEPLPLSGVPLVEEVDNTPKIQEIVSMSIAEPDDLPVGILYADMQAKTAEEKPYDILPSIVEETAEIPEQKPMKEVPMTKEEAMGFGRKKFFLDDEPTTIKPEPVINPFMNNNSGMMGTPSYPQSMGNMPYRQNPNMYGQRYQQPYPTQYQPQYQQPDYTSIFQMGANSGPLLRPIDNGTPAMMNKTCPVCGSGVKPDCPICVVCGHRF